MTPERETFLYKAENRRIKFQQQLYFLSQVFQLYKMCQIEVHELKVIQV